jgi:hypothetical protein
MRLDQLKISAAGSRLRCRLYRGALKREPAQCGEVEGKAEQDSNGGGGDGAGGGGDQPAIDPIIAGLLKRLPNTGDTWPPACDPVTAARREPSMLSIRQRKIRLCLQKRRRSLPSQAMRYILGYIQPTLLKILSVRQPQKKARRGQTEPR